MKWLVYGSKGWIGSALVKILESLHIPDNHVYHGESRVNDLNSVEEEIKKIAPDRVLSLIGRTSGPGYNTIDYLEQKGKLVENINDNLFSPVLLALVCKKYDIHFTYMGTGCIFKYDNDKFALNNGNGFKESDLPNFFGSSYSTVKGFTDRLFHVMEECGYNNLLNIRIRMPITADMHPKNFITKICNYEKVVNIPNSMTVLPELLPIMIDMSLKKVTGTVNLTNPGTISHNEILDMYREIVDNTKTYTNFTEEEQDKILLSERSNNLLDTTCLSTLYPHVKDIKTSVRDILNEIKKNNTEIFLLGLKV